MGWLGLACGRLGLRWVPLHMCISIVCAWFRLCICTVRASLRMCICIAHACFHVRMCIA